MNEAIETLVARWAEPGGIPFKGQLISDDGCMCAQGQALHYIGGWRQGELKNVEQPVADRETARLLGISLAHSVLLRQVNDSRPGAPSVVLTDPAQVLGDQAETVLAFWWHLDRMSSKDWQRFRAAWVAARAAAEAAAKGDAWVAAEDAAWAAARDAAGDAARAAAEAAAEAAAKGDAWVAAGYGAHVAARASHEIQGARILRERGQPFFFLPMFGFADPEAVLDAYRNLRSN